MQLAPNNVDTLLQMFEQLPDEVVRMIVNYLPTTRDRLNVALTCRDMYKAVRDTACLANFNASHLISTRIDHMFGYLSILKNLGVQITRLKFDRNSTFMLMFQAHIPDMSTFLPNLVDLFIRRSGNVHHLHFLKQQRHLKKLTLENVGASPVEFRNALTDMGTQLLKLSLAHNPQISKCDIMQIVKQCDNLEFLDVTGTQPLCPTAVHAIILLCPRLRTFIFTPHDEESDAHTWVEAVQGKYSLVTYHIKMDDGPVDHKKHIKCLKRRMKLDVESDSDIE